jgi:hypothetical protein
MKGLIMMYAKRFFLLWVLLMFAASLHARQNYSEQGIKTYLKLCKQCHGNPYKGAAMLKKREWKRLFEKGDEKIYALHAKNEKALTVLNSSYYQNRRRHLVKFLVSSGSDSGVVPACDGNFCGD